MYCVCDRAGCTVCVTGLDVLVWCATGLDVLVWCV